MFMVSFRAMNTQIQLAAEGDPEMLESGFAQSRRLIEDYEKRFTRFSPISELSALNAHNENNPDSWFRASAEFYELMIFAQDMHRQTAGLFDPSILPALRYAGYDRSMDELRSAGPQVNTQQPPAPQANFTQVKFDNSKQFIKLPKGMQIDLGGIAKGWIAEQAARRLKLFADSCIVNAGGDLYTVGLPAGQNAWEIGLEDPLHTDRDLALLKAQPGGIATSSVTKRRWVQNGKEQHHLIDPRSGRPAQTDWLSVTVFAEHTAEAEVFSKALLIAGSKQASIVGHHEKVKAFLAVDRDGKIWQYQCPSPAYKEVMYVEPQYA